MKNNFLTRHPLLAVFLFTIICLIPEMLMRDFTPSNELRYLSIADEALAGGNFFAFFNHGAAYADKPPLYLWIVMLCKTLTGGHSVFALTLFSILPAFVIVWLMDRWVMSKASVSDRMSMAMMLLTCVMFLGTAVVIRMDMLMCMFIALALFTFWRMYELRMDGEPDGGDAVVYKKCSWLLPVWIFMALFTKGPVGLLVPPVSIVVFLIAKRKWRDIGKYLGLKTWGVIAALCAIWFICVFFDGGMEYLDNLLFKQTMGRAVKAFTHSRPFWFYAVAILWCIAPYTFILVGSLVESVWPSGKNKTEIPAESVRSDLEIFFLCIIGSTFVMLSSFSSKLPVYLVPMFPFVVYLFPLVSSRKGTRRWLVGAIAIPAAIISLAALVSMLVLAGIVNVNALVPELYEYNFAFSGATKIAAALLFIGNLLALWFLFRRRQWNLPVFMMGASLLLMIYAASGVLVKANPYMGYREVCQDVPEGTEVVTLFVHRPENMDVYLGRQIIDYEKNADAFLRDASDSTALGGKTFTLVTTTDRLDGNDALRDFVYSSGTVTYSGPYCVVTSKPGKHPVK